jgi:hypothetical protein
MSNSESSSKKMVVLSQSGGNCSDFCDVCGKLHVDLQSVTDFEIGLKVQPVEAWKLFRMNPLEVFSRQDLGHGMAVKVVGIQV